MKSIVMKKKAENILGGVPGEIRTHGLKIRNFALYPAELQGQNR